MKMDCSLFDYFSNIDMEYQFERQRLIDAHLFFQNKNIPMSTNFKKYIFILEKDYEYQLSSPIPDYVTI